MQKSPAPKAPPSAAQHMSSGLQFAITVVLCAYGGWWADARWGTSPLLLIGGCLFGGVAGFYHLYRTLVGPPVKTAKPETTDTPDEGTPS